MTMNKTAFISILSVLIVLSGFAFFYFLKIMPAQDKISYAKTNIHMYQETVATNQKKLAEQKKALADKKKQAEKEEKLGQKVDNSILPKNPDVEPFFTTVQKKAASIGVTFISVEKSNDGSGDSSSDSSSTEDQSSSSDSSSSSAATTNDSKSSTENKSDNKIDPDKLLKSNTYQVSLQSLSDAQLYVFVGYLETQKRLVVINKMTSSRINNDSSISVDNSSRDASSSTDSQATVQASSDGSDDQTSSADANSQIDAASAQSDSSISIPTIEANYQMNLTITIYSAKK